MADTTDDLLTRVKNKETLPDSGAAYSESVLLEYLDQSLKGFIVPAIEATLEEHFVVTRDFTMPVQPSYGEGNPPVNVTNVIYIPGESVGMRLRDIYLVGNDGSFYNLPRLTPTQAAAQNFGNINWSMSYNNQTAAVGGFFLQGNQVQIFPYGLANNKIIRITFQRAPADLTLVANAGLVTNVVGDVVTIDKVQNTWISGVTRINAIKGTAPHDYCPDMTQNTVVYGSFPPLDDVLLTSISGGNVLTLPAGTGAGIAVGDWIALRGYSVFAQNIPKEVLPALVQKAAEMCIHAAGDSEGWKVARTEFSDMLGMALKMIAPRVIGKPVKLLPTNSAFKASRARGTVGRR